MKKFQKLTREEMKNVTGGVNGCDTGSCYTSIGCSSLTVGQVCRTGYNGAAGTCGQCLCNGTYQYPCQVS